MSTPFVSGPWGARRLRLRPSRLRSTPEYRVSTLCVSCEYPVLFPPCGVLGGCNESQASLRSGTLPCLAGPAVTSVTATPMCVRESVRRRCAALPSCSKLQVCALAESVMGSPHHGLAAAIMGSPHHGLAAAVMGSPHHGLAAAAAALVRVATTSAALRCRCRALSPSTAVTRRRCLSPRCCEGDHTCI